MSAIGDFIVEFVVEPLLGFAPDARTDRGDAMCCTCSGALSATAIVLLFYLSRAPHPESTPTWVTTAALFFFLLAVAGLLYAADRIIERPRSRSVFGVAACVNMLAIALPFWLVHLR